MSVGDQGRGALPSVAAQTDLELLLASNGSDNGRAWNVGLLLGAVTQFCRTMRFDPTASSSMGFRRYMGVLQNTICLFTEAISLRESVVERFAEFVDGIEGTYNSEWHAELLNAWSVGEVEAADVKVATGEPLNLARFQEMVERIIPEIARVEFRAGLTCGESWVICQTQLRNDLPLATLPQTFIAAVCFEAPSTNRDLSRTLQLYLAPELESRIKSVFRSQCWNLEDWFGAVLHGGQVGGAWNQLTAVHTGIDWISSRLTSSELTPNEAESDSGEDGPRESDPGNAVDRPRTSDGFENAQYLGIWYSVLARAVRREGHEHLLRFDSRLLPWELFLSLVRNRANYCSRRTLRSCWLAAGRSEPVSDDDNAIDQAIRELRGILIPLGLRVENSPKIGWRLE